MVITMKAVILDGATMGADIDFSPIESVCDTQIFAATEPQELARRICDADVVILNKVVLSEAVLSGAKRLKLICVFAVGYNNIDIEYCRKHGISVRNVPGYCTESVCQHTFALLFSLAEKLSYYDGFVKSGAYSRGKTANHIGKPFDEISGMNWGIIGMGSIGRRVADCAAAFGANVCYSSISGAVREEKYPNVPLDVLLGESDIISVHAPLNEKTIGLIGAEELSKMKSTAVIVNVGRGAITDEAALAEALKNGKIAGAAIDVFSEEPPRADNPLLSVPEDRIVFSPHIAWASVGARRRCIEMTADNIKTFINGEKHNDVC